MKNRKIINHFKHLKVVLKHKYYVMVECFRYGLYFQGILHDLSKFSLSEFIQSAEFFQGTGTPIAKIKAELVYSSAWLHHKGHNKHHWEYWTDFYDGTIKPCKIPEKYLIEMVCDMVGASKAYLNSEYNQKEPLNYFKIHSQNWLMFDDDKRYMETLLIEVANRTN